MMSVDLALKFQAFTDDSAAQIGDRRLFLAGFVHLETVWRRFSEHWINELHSGNRIEYFKAAEAQNLRDQFSYKVGWTAEKRDQKIDRLARIIELYDPFSFEISVNRQLFEDKLRPQSPFGLGRPHFALCFGVVSGVSRYFSEVGSTLPIEFVFDEQDGVDDDIALMFSEMVKNLPQKTQSIIQGQPSFRNDKDPENVVLQAADLLAWSLRRQHETSEELPWMRRLVRHQRHIIQRVPDELVMSWADHFASDPNISRVATKKQWREIKREMKLRKQMGAHPFDLRSPTSRNQKLGFFELLAKKAMRVFQKSR